MTDVVERVARALCANDETDPDEDWGGTPAWVPYTKDARVAIEAHLTSLLDPAPEMVEAGKREILAGSIGALANGAAARAAWRAMVRSLLTPAAVEGEDDPAPFADEIDNDSE